MARRAKWEYADPQLDNYTDKKVNRNFFNQIDYMIDVIKYQCAEMDDILHVASNPDEHTDRYYQKKNPQNTAFYDSRKSTFDKLSRDGDKLSLNGFNKLIEINWGLLNNVHNIMGNPGAGLKDLPKFNENEKLTMEKFNIILENIRKTNTYLNNNWGKYFDGSGYCVMSCQVACQAACQLACQSCQYNTCHNQNCGGWS